MQSPYKRIVVYDLETGGLSCKFNAITEMAAVVVDLETLEIIEEFSVMFSPRIDFRNREEDFYKEAKVLIKGLAEKDLETGISTLNYKGQKVTLRNYTETTIEEDLEEFFTEVIEEYYPSGIIGLKEIKEIEKTKYRDVLQLYFNKTYNPQALEVTKISRSMMEKEGVEYEEAFNKIQDLIKRHTIGNSKPIVAGHNVGWLPRRLVKGKEVSPNGFDNPFMEKLFSENGSDFFDSVNDVIMDTLQMARVRWASLPSYSLGVCANEVGLTLEEAHRALPDTIANAKFLIKLLKSLRGEGSQKSKYVRKKYDLPF